ncbi:hypothetical protein LRS06_15445 [Hymenobacter sp. J193]|uniref:7TMR-DISM family protein n=1 Tax=Hymenobacter sp. J193 TaxID=2898429 RepID=UPI002150F6AD|nr:7TM diverse intracellular signaling domain-containing protein [Hymenobacter sp. J193]MCR5889131.1 hypothetical protein [Hymenobacter sp. J193]
MVTCTGLVNWAALMTPIMYYQVFIRFSLVWRPLLVCCLLANGLVTAQAAPRHTAEDTLRLQKGLGELFVDPGFYSILEDPTNQLTLAQVQQQSWSSRFNANHPDNRAIRNTSSTYWMRLTLHNTNRAEQHWYLETFDSHIGYLTFYHPTNAGRYDSIYTGAERPFASRQYPYKNFLFPLPLQAGQTQTYYLKFQSTSKTSFLSRLRNEQLLAAHTQTEYGLLGAFYGILFIMVVYNLCIYLFIGEQTYLRYVLYVLSCSLLFLSEDGLGFQFFWPSWPWLNSLVNTGTPLLLLLTFSYYARMFLDAPQQLPRYDRLTRMVVLISAGLLLLDMLVLETGLSFWLYMLPYGMIYYAALQVYWKGFKPARYFLLAHALVAISVLFLITRKLGISFFTNTFTVYSMNMALVLEVAVLSYALGDKIKGIKDATIRAQEKVVKQLRKRHQAQDQLVEQLRQNQELKDQLNSDLEAQVAKRTEELRRQSETIVAQNRELLQANGLLALQSAAIEKLNTYLDAGFQHRPGELAGMRRNRHHGNAGQPTQPGTFHDALRQQHGQS